jgi:hypothetical protein
MYRGIHLSTEIKDSLELAILIAVLKADIVALWLVLAAWAYAT